MDMNESWGAPRYTVPRSPSARTSSTERLRTRVFGLASSELSRRCWAGNFRALKAIVRLVAFVPRVLRVADGFGLDKIGGGAGDELLESQLPPEDTGVDVCSGENL